MGKVTVAILAGGESTRMGTDKTLECLLGRPLLAHVLAGLEGLGHETILITNTPDQHAGLGLPMYEDAWPGRGALVGLYTALTYAICPYTLVVAADMPFLNRDLLDYMIGLAPGYDVVVPRLAAGLEGLHAVYSKRCREPVRARLEARRYKVTGFYEAVRVRYVDEPEIDRFDPAHHSFFNINTPDDLDSARRIALDL